mmetsp:Transcript_17242/g.44802  ORF Transcript_17242/g.44802 Transcript_17242/m.44802 type:complete len:121 (-) Transcript_17242:386-748(-)
MPARGQGPLVARPLACLDNPSDIDLGKRQLHRGICEVKHTTLHFVPSTTRGYDMQRAAQHRSDFGRTFTPLRISYAEGPGLSSQQQSNHGVCAKMPVSSCSSRSSLKCSVSARTSATMAP